MVLFACTLLVLTMVLAMVKDVLEWYNAKTSAHATFVVTVLQVTCLFSWAICMSKHG
jgi:hypothetical protein